MTIGNQPAYPVPMIPNGDGGYTEVRCTGMTYRQWLIGKIVGGWASDAPGLKTFSASDEAFRTAARACIRLADAAIAELDAEGGK